MRFLVPIILLIASSVIFFGFIDPAYKKVSDLNKEARLFNEALENSEELLSVRDNLLSKYNSMSTNDRDRLEKLLPNNVDNVRLVRDIDGIASKYGMSLRNVDVETQKSSGNINTAAAKIGSIMVTFSVTSSYTDFLSFLRDLERSLRIVDIANVSFISSEEDLYEYRITLRTYWLK